MSKLYKCIYLSWRSGRGGERYLVGELIEENGTLTFQYLKENIEKAKDKGFFGYPGINIDWVNTDKRYENALPIFEQRLISLERTDLKPFFQFWEINESKKNDPLYMLAMTQGIVPTDNFEFLASFEPSRDLCFVTDVAGLSYTNFDLKKLTVNDKLTWKRKDIKNIDSDAIELSFKNQLVGYVKQGHKEIFLSKHANSLIVEVKAISNKKLFVKIKF